MTRLRFLCFEVALFFFLWTAIGVHLPWWRVALVGAIVGMFVALGRAQGQAA